VCGEREWRGGRGVRVEKVVQDMGWVMVRGMKLQEEMVVQRGARGDVQSVARVRVGGAAIRLYGCGSGGGGGGGGWCM